MLSKEEADPFRYPERLCCRICFRRIPITQGPFCEEHSLLYERRQREGVATDELSHQWGDTLDTWRGRPSELDRELGTRADTTPVEFQQRHEPWLLFMRTYYHVFPRGGDWLAINTRTGEIRRFVDVGENDVLDELEGVRPAPYQAELAPFWGQAGPIGPHQRLEQQYLEGHRLHISALVQAAPFPVYGLAGRPLDFSVCSVSWGRTGYRLRSIGFIFSSPRYPDVRENFSITSSDAKERGLRLHAKEFQGTALFERATDLFERFHQSNAEQEQSGNPFLWEGYSTLGGMPFIETFRYWSQPQSGPLLPGKKVQALFSLKGEKTILGGDAFGPSREELLHLLDDLIVLNERDDLLTQYQHELDREHARLFGGKE